MRETQPGGVQEDAPQRPKKPPSGADLCGGAIESIANERMASGGEVGSNLVGAPCARLGFNQCEISHAQQGSPIGLGSAARGEARGHARAALGIAGNGTIDLSRVPRQAAVYQGNVCLAYGARAELLAKNTVSGVIARDEDRSGGAPVEAMDNSGAKIPTDRGEGAEVMEERVYEGAAAGSGSGVNDHARGLIHDGDIFVLVKNVEGDLFRSGAQGRAREDFYVDHISGHYALCRPHEAAAEANAAFVDQLLNASAAEVGQTRGEIEVEAAAGIFRRSDKVAQNNLLSAAICC